MRIILALFVVGLMSYPAYGQSGTDGKKMPDDHHQSMTLKETDRKLVSMTINKLMETQQDAVEVNGKIYYGCLPCKDTAVARESVDPISGQPVDKATAFLGTAPDGSVYYFESEENLHTFGNDPSKYLNPLEIEP